MLTFYLENLWHAVCMWDVHSFHLSVLHSESSLRQGLSAGGRASVHTRAGVPTGVLGYVLPGVCTPCSLSDYRGVQWMGVDLFGLPLGHPLETWFCWASVSSSVKWNNGSLPSCPAGWLQKCDETVFGRLGIFQACEDGPARRTELCQNEALELLCVYQLFLKIGLLKQSRACASVGLLKEPHKCVCVCVCVCVYVCVPADV